MAGWFQTANRINKMMTVFRGITCHDMKTFGSENRVNGYLMFWHLVSAAAGRQGLDTCDLEKGHDWLLLSSKHLMLGATKTPLLVGKFLWDNKLCGIHFPLHHPRSLIDRGREGGLFIIIISRAWTEGLCGN